MLSPKAAPERIAPPRSAGFAPTAIPAGKSVRLIALMVPKPEPVEIANRPENRNVTTVNVSFSVSNRAEAHTKPSTMCPSFRILPYTPTISHSRVAVIAVLLPKYSKMVAQYPLLFLVIMPPIMIATIPITTNRLILIALKNDRMMVAPTNKAKGRTAAKGDSPTSVVLLLFILTEVSQA